MRRVNQSGFSLLEMAMALLIVGLLVASFTGIWALVSDTDHQGQEREKMDTISRSLNMFLMVNSHLPCPDSDVPPDGEENRNSAGACSVSQGGLPYNDLGVEGLDAWGEPYFYMVHPDSTDNTSGSDNTVYQVCQEASVFGKSVDAVAPVGLDDLWFCSESNMYYCYNTSAADADCDVANYDLVENEVTVTVTDPVTGVETDIDVYREPRPNVNQDDSTVETSEAPFFHLATPPIGVHTADTPAGQPSNNLLVRNESGEPIADGVLAIAVSWGANGEVFNQNNCPANPANEHENCDGDGIFVKTLTEQNRDFLTWVTMSQAKTAMIKTGELR